MTCDFDNWQIFVLKGSPKNAQGNANDVLRKVLEDFKKTLKTSKKILQKAIKCFSKLSSIETPCLWRTLEFFKNPLSVSKIP